MGPVSLPTFPRGAVLLARRIAIAPESPAVAAVLLAALGLVEVVLRGGRPVGNLLQDLVLALCTTLPLAFVRTHLLHVGAVVTVAVLLTLGLGRQPTVGGLLAQTAVLYLIGARNSYRTAVLFAVPYVAYAVGPAESRTGGKLLGVVLLVLAAGALAVGSSRRSRTETADRTAASGAYAHMALAYAAREERARIARELHDIVAHHISSISVQAETTRLTTPGLPAEGATRLLAIGETARLALAEMRRLLSVLRDDAGAASAQLPQPGLGQLITLVDEARDTVGPAVRLIIRGRIRPLDPGLELTAYRIVQEALTNARKHAPGAAVDIEVRYADDTLRLSIWDAGSATGTDSPGTDHPGTGSPGGGYGLLGMRERVAMAGGRLRTGRSRAGGFVVQAILPVPGADR
jgi:signal transduction histidine kinase